MNIYIAARAKTRSAEVKDIQQKLRSMGHNVSYDWANVNIKQPYRDPANRIHNIAATKTMLKSAAESDVFILLDEPGLRGAYVELGAFLYDCLIKSESRTVYIVGPRSHERQFVFESPEYVKFVEIAEEVFTDLAS